ncbi:tRNAHis guanylyltransferase-domain-containing protein [Elsinoe ampelina]|uniref:tRNA(His) guanylyltransferase n=1 Tax=Elsinoe ampelina TaxID=302913 RepID=A0A6A6GGJ8_9PEZI|nr:tRNAHis guanylyltransferase-domain-containing protein [Elsinoe ampelina]
MQGQPVLEMASTPTALADRMKHYEANYEYTLSAGTPTILRLDGHTFSKFTSHFCRPFDQRIHDAMIATCDDLLRYFPQATVAYTFSDEITLVFPHGTQSYKERVQKLASLASSYCSVRFNSHLASCLSSNPEPRPAETALGRIGTAHFDARFYTVPTVEEALNCLLWRCRHDAVRNSVGAFARTLYTTRELHGKSTQEVLNMLRTEKGLVFEDSVPRWAVEGCLLKRQQVEQECINHKTGAKEISTRTAIGVEERGVRDFTPENLKLVTDKFW